MEKLPCVDPLRLNELDPLIGIILDPAIVKVFHAGSQDLEIFCIQWKSASPCFDTQLAATAGFGSSWATLTWCKNCCRVNSTKGTHEPIGQTPASGRTTALCPGRRDIPGANLYGSDKQIKKWGGGLVAGEFDQLANPDTYRMNPASAWKKSGTSEIAGVQLAVLQSLAAWRENLAVESDRPRRWIVKDEILVDMAGKGKNIVDLSRAGGWIRLL